MAQNQAKLLNVYNVVKAIEEVSKWYELGTMLELEASRLNIIEANYRTVERCKIALVQEWLNNHGASWGKLASALESIGHRNLADTIKDYGQGTSSSSASKEPNGSKNSPDEGTSSMIQGMTPLMIASRLGHIDVVRKLVAKGANVNMQNEDGLSALMFACENRHLEVVRELVAKKAQIDMKRDNGKSALMIASQLGYIEIVEYLLENGAQVDIKAYNGASPLIFASQFGQAKIVGMLLKGGADVNLQTDGGYSALMSACDTTQTDVIGHIEDARRIEVIRLLIASGAQIDLQTSDGMTALLFATLTGRADIAQELLAKDANVDVQLHF